jgi:drug/metabolite transporter (DMT)-like permease
VALLEGVAAGTLFGTAAVLIRILSGFSVFSLAFWRLVIASVILGVLILVWNRDVNWHFFRKASPRVAILGVLLGVHFMLFVSAVFDTSILNATVLVNTTPIWSMFVSALVFKLKPGRNAIFGILMSFLGVFIITYASAPSLEWSHGLKGNLEAILAAVVEAFYLSYGRETRRKASVLPLMLIIYVFSGLTVLVVGVMTKASFAFPSEIGMILALFGLGLLPTAMAHSFYFSSLSHLKSFETATMALLEPVGATLLGILAFSEVPGPIFVLGAVFVLAGIFFVALRK